MKTQSALFLVSMIVATAGCGSSTPLKDDITNETSTTPAAGELQCLDGSRRPIVHDEHQGTLLAFWSTSCVHCVAEMPELARFHQNQGRAGIEVIGVNVGETARRVEAFLSVRSVPFPIAVDRDQTLWQRFGVKAVPTLVLVDRDGEVRYFAHALPEDHTHVTRLLSSPSSQTTYNPPVFGYHKD